MLAAAVTSLMCQPEGPRRLVKHYSGCVYGGVSGGNEHLNRRLSQRDCIL